jgi:hypothetical protein
VQAQTIPVTLTGTQVYGSSSPSFTPSYTAPSGVTVSGTVACATVNGGTGIGPSLDAGSYTIVGSSCSGLTVPPGYAVSYTGGTFSVTQASQVIVSVLSDADQHWQTTQANE